MICAIHQPQYLPWLGYFDKIDKVDVFVFLDNVQYKKNEWQNRNKIRTQTGWQYLTVPVKYKFGQLINKVEIDNTKKWRHKHWQALLINYSKAEFFHLYKDFFKKIYEKEWSKLVDINISLIIKITEFLGMETKFIKASELKTMGEKTDRLISICKEVGANVYLSGIGAKEYIEEEKLKKERIELVFQNFKHPVYKQVFNGFVPNLSIVDLLFNEGENSLFIIRGKNENISDRSAS